MSDIALVTANFGGIDDAKPLPEHAGIDAFYFTDADHRERISAEAARTWTRVVVPDYPRADFSPRLRSRYFKHQIHRIEGIEGYRWLVWADATLLFHELDFVHALVARLVPLPSAQRVVLVPHPERTSVLEEYRHISQLIADGSAYHRERYGDENMDGQIATYRRRGWSLGTGLWCGGFWMIENNDALRRCWDDWWDDNLRLGVMDQLSLPVHLARHAIRPQDFDVLIWRNPHFAHVQHPVRGVREAG